MRKALYARLLAAGGASGGLAAAVCAHPCVEHVALAAVLWVVGLWTACWRKVK